MELCPCGSGLALNQCCKPVIDGERKAKTAEELMRARYTAHVIKSFPFLMTSTHPAFREDVDSSEIEKWSTALQWEGLDILDKSKGEAEDSDGTVSFRANYTIQGMPQNLTEDGFFRKEGDDWYYVEGNVHQNEPARRKEPKIGRNDPCPCGSGKKYKKCCGQNN